LSRMKHAWIGLLDCNNFFASCERLFRPDLVGKPVLVLSSNDGCVVARSQEVKDIGVPMGVPYFQIKDIVKKHSITTFSSHFALYRDISRRVMTVLREQLDTVEQYSVDEAFFTVTEHPEEVAKRLKQEVERVVGIPVSVGIARTKTLAKYANVLAKKGVGIRVLDTPELLTTASQIPLVAIWGVGGKMELRYKQHGLATVADLLAADTARISRLFGISGLRLQRELSGEPSYFVAPRLEPQQSIMSSRSFKNTVSDSSTLMDAVAYHVRHVAADLRKMEQGATQLAVSIRPSRHGDFMLRGGTVLTTFDTPTSDSFELMRAAARLTEKLYEAGVPYKKAGVTVSGLRSLEVQQESLFEPASTPKATAAVSELIDTLNDHTGREVVLLGSRLKSQKWQSRHDVRSPAYTTRWSDVASVSA
ncbi:MAG: Y-family DNA polymerase, partial [Candidatus Kaiserbacteria bacterium]|nr:Y-family DNA polymerase [Candidatus Kaiserbacteria bacterium]